MALLEVNEVIAGYGVGPDILTGISLEVDTGRSYCIIGPNGAGKSTLLKAVCGILRPRQGEIRFDGIKVSGMRPDQMLARGVCFVPQEQSLFPEMTVRENLAMGGFLIKQRAVVNKRMERVFDLFPALEDRRHQLAGRLSGGEQRMVALGRALMMDPKLLMIDEPSLGLAPLVADQIFTTIVGFQAMGITVLVVEQNCKRGLENTDWGIVLELGDKRFEGPSDTILDDPRMRELYLGGAVCKPEDAQ
jgi:branched-chain amino acid transport system ATP-binding protein